jgi:ribonuclease HII
VTFPTLELETELLKTHQAIIGIDEVGRGSLAGPIAVAAFVLKSERLGQQPPSLKDSKLIREAKRSQVASEVRSWGEYAVSFVDAEFIDKSGIIAALRRAGHECLEKLAVENSAILLDGNQNWLELKNVTIRTKADRDCASVAAASVIAKVERDQLMIELSEKYPQYGFESNKGYSSDFHIQALRSFGPCEIHRKTWLSEILSESLF